MNIVAEITLEALRKFGIETLPLYEEELIKYCEKFSPIFGKKWYLNKYRESCSNTTWFINSLISNAAKEGDGSKQLWEMSSRVEDKEISELIRIHAIDEMRHGRFYVGMIKLTFLDKKLHDKVDEMMESLLPNFKLDEYPTKKAASSPKVILDELIQINIGEIRTRIHQLMLHSSLLKYTPSENIHKIENIMEKIISDETRHIAYTSKIINTAIANGERDYVREVMDHRWQEFNSITYEEVF